MNNIHDIFYGDTYPWVECPLDTEYRVEGDRMFIRGTDSIENHLTNLDICGHNLYHHGFYKMANAILASPGFYDVISSQGVVQIVGHSAGGAVAAILAERLEILSMAINTPRFVKRKILTKEYLQLNNYYQDNCMILNQRYDVISYLPPLFGYPCKVQYQHYFHWNPYKVHAHIDI